LAAEMGQLRTRRRSCNGPSTTSIGGQEVGGACGWD
jgi:hypothetical protein